MTDLSDLFSMKVIGIDPMREKQRLYRINELEKSLRENIYFQKASITMNLCNYVKVLDLLV